MHYTGNIYRPPLEANTPLLEVTYGCSWNKCSFCTMYANTKFGASPLHHIEEDVKEIKQAYGENTRKLFIVNGDAFTLPTQSLLKIGEIIHKHLPKVETISCYASIRNIKTKSLHDLEKLRNTGYNNFYIGLESANDYALELMNKGYTQEDEYENLQKLEKAGIDYNAIIMYGITGQGRSDEHINETVKLLNRYKPRVILSMSTSVQPGTPLEEYRKEGKFIDLTERELISEERSFIEKLCMDDDCYYFGSHPYNLLRLSNYFKNKEEMLEYIDTAVEKIDENEPGLLDKVLNRGSL